MFIVNFKNILKKLHCWLKKDPEKNNPIHGCNIILVGVDGYLISNLLMPNILNSAGVNSTVGVAYIIAILGIMLGIIEWTIAGIYESIRGQKFDIPVKYKFLGLLLFAPLLWFIDKIVAAISIDKNYDTKIKSTN